MYKDLRRESRHTRTKQRDFSFALREINFLFPVNVEAVNVANKVLMVIGLALDSDERVQEHCTPKRDHEIRHLNILIWLRIDLMSQSVKYSIGSRALTETKDSIERPVIPDGLENSLSGFLDSFE